MEVQPKDNKQPLGWIYQRQQTQRVCAMGTERMLTDAVN
jgi:hypothetical protein